MEQKDDSRRATPPGERVRELGYDPDYLTQQEQVELLTLERRMSSARPTGVMDRPVDAALDLRR